MNLQGKSRTLKKQKSKDRFHRFNCNVVSVFVGTENFFSHDIKNALNYATHILHLEQENDFFGTVEEYKKSNVSNMFLGGVAND